MRRLLLLGFLIGFFLSEAWAQLAPVDSVLEGRITRSITLRASKRYLLRGFVNVDPPATLRIEPGTIIFGEKATKGTLIINRGARIIAEGTPTRPIVFTSQQPRGQRAPGDWGGIIIAGRAPINVPGGTAEIEGGTGTVYGGGANPDPNDNSGVLRYVRIEFPGIAFLPDNEINGLTLGGVGRGTIIEYVQVSYCGDDAFEWFGGTVNARYLISYANVDDDFDTDFGYQGRVQFALAVRDPNIADIGGSNGFESDNDGTGTTNAPRTSPVFSNVTLIGPAATAQTSISPNFRRGMHIRRSSLLSAYNSIVMGWPEGLLLDGSVTTTAARDGELEMRNFIVAGIRTSPPVRVSGAPSGFDQMAWFQTPAWNNRLLSTTADVGLVNPYPARPADFDPRPRFTSPAVAGASFAWSRLQDPFFQQVAYVGAFDPNTRWDLPWANYDPQNTDYSRVGTSVEATAEAPSLELDVYPNPFVEDVRIRLRLPEAASVRLAVYDLLGREIARFAEGPHPAGYREWTWRAGKIPAGLYYVQLRVGDQVLHRPVVRGR
ncbi:MAG: T9SS type A sorting domain-containing protein [Bacteroidetes bacterium]|nr:T9SS type A sorting domain-containing protein [Rhodothermia bacterium]MCS7155768.1 T9SS type A sorting domain-containing protein [Bacteroidota bacterium]MCX7906131.1 T9SS type A sorting domain-containing protein [Bacteroidota bacterium]MDW8138259.1 T9SS type A sorting domain-containing protein [Bacteroidota bacterium]MDW8285943.1 T9SS type A sorting domain-containing protein [Bacteroidota bacterium]